MSIYKNGKLIAGGRQCMPLLSFMWADHQLNDASWLRADTFSWQSGSVYQAAYQHLADDYNNTGEHLYGWSTDTFSKTPYPSVGDVLYRSDGTEWSTVAFVARDYSYIIRSDGVAQLNRNTSIDTVLYETYTETISGITITYYQAPDGHKLVLPDQESNVTAIYNATGVAWYYIVDTTNQRFKLPRTKFGFTGIRSGVGNYVEAGLPNITGTFYRNAFIGSSGASQNSISGAFTSTNANGYHAGGGGLDNSAGVITLNASRSSSIYGNSDTVQPKATEMYLYFYVGNFTQTALENTAGITTEEMNEKLDIDLGNATSATKQTVGGWCMPDYTTGTSKSWDTSYLADSDTMICYQTNHQSGNPNVTPQVSQDGSTWITLYGQNAGSSNFKIGGWFFCPKGWYWKMVGGRNVDRMLTAYSMKSAT